MNALKRRQVTGFAIDGPTSKDLDDAIQLRKEKDGYIVVVSIADVSHTVKKDSDIDLRARERAFTRYFRNSNSPMLPHRLSENLLSLVPRLNRDVIVFEIRLNDDFEVTNVTVELGRFKAPRRFTHKQVDDILENKRHKHHQQWMAYYKFAEALLNRRRESGAMVIYDLSMGLYTTEEGQVIQKTPGLYFRPYIIVQEFMILANRAVTEYLGSKGVPLLYRNHASLVSDINEKELLRRLYGSTEELTTEVLSELNERVRRMAGRARYESSCKSHFGLNLPAYAHWTSPIRRYADLVNHRQLVAWLTQSPYPYTADQIAAIGDHINELQDEAKDRTSGLYKAEAVEGIRNANETELLALAKGYFTLFIKLLTEEEISLTEMRAVVIRVKLQENALLLADQVRILFSEVPDEVLWRQTQENVLQAIVANPVNVQATLQLAQTMMGWEPSVRHTQVSDGVFAAEITITRGERSYASELCEGHGKGDAEIKAFVGLLQTMTSIHIEIPKGKKVPTDSGNYKGQLMELCQGNRWPFPTFDHSQTGPSNQPIFTCTAELQRSGEEKLVTEVCKATTKKAAERMASRAMLQLLGVSDVPRPASTAISKVVAGAVSTDCKSNPISTLQEYCQKKGYSMPEYTDHRSGQDHTPNFKVTCTVMVDNSLETFEAEGPNKKEAKRNAAAKACEKVFV